MTQSVSSLAPSKERSVQGWVDCLRWAGADDEVVSRFCAETGITVESAPNDDSALGVAFIRWFNANIWGEVDGRACNGDED